MNNPACPLCSSTDAQTFHRDAFREYLICSVCDLVFAHPDSHLDREEEFSRYEYHENDINDQGYRNFLEKLELPMLERVTPESQGLDFGSGPGPLLKLMFEEQGHTMSIFDTFYAPDPSVFDRQYDFISSSEVVEHLHHPMGELDRLWSCLKPGGFLGIMTSMRHGDLDFNTWHYIKDDTHVIFFSPQTMRWLADRWEASLEIIGNSVIILQKKGVWVNKAGIRIPALK